VNVVCYQVEVSASGRSLVQRSPTECGVSECGRETSKMRRPWTTRGCCAISLQLVLKVAEELSRKEFSRKSET
jgi:hypothetical protein